ncbi:phage tail spike protein [Thalassobacillus sp. C254]|uniref:phage tail spike protein n=1 Tax=Thalassobacillus sp. C254 TaxID=1225341 RepID=UPI0006D08BD2|nr:phage tail spike protein [Thalassobacillus sp. C254]
MEWSLENGDPFDKPLGQEWVGDEEARVIHGRWQNDQWVHKYGDFEDSEEEDPEELIKSAALALEEEAKPRINYRVKATDLEYMTDEFGEKMDHEKTRLGDVCLAINDDFKPAMREQVNIIKDTQYLGEPERREFEMGNFLPLFTDDDRLDQLQREFNDRKKLIDDAKRGPIEDKDFPDIVPNVPEEVEVIGLFQNVLVRWKYEAAIYLSGFEVYASQTSGFAPSPETMIYRGNTNSVMLEGETDNQYYFRLRAINVHGTPSEFTEEFSAQTARIKTPDLMFGSVTKDILDDLSVTAEKLADNSVGSSKILDEAINDAKIAADAVRNIHIENNAVDNDKLDDLAVTAAKLADGSVQRDKILDDAINSAKIAADAVRKIHIENNAVDNDKLDDLAVTAAKLASGSVEESKIKDMAITKAKIAEAAVGTAAIEDLAVTNAKIDNIHAEKITAGTVAAERVAIGSGTSFSSGYDPSEKETPSGAQSKANAAESSAKSHADSAASAAEQNAKDYAVEQVPIRWSTSEDSRDWVILLCSVGSGNSNFATGRLYGKRVSGHANSAVIDIVVNHTNNDLPSGAFRSVGVQSSTDYELVKCEYNGREYVGLRYTGGAMYQVWTQGAFFDGAYASSGGDAMRAVDTDDLSSYETLDNRYDAAEKSSAKIEWPGGSSDGANYAEGRVQLWQYADTVYIDGGNIYANSVTANQMATGTITAASGIIDDAAITEAKIADAAIGNAALQNAIIGKAQLQEAIIEDVHIEDTTISNAKIRSVSADKVEVGELIGHTLRSGTLESSVIKTSRFEALHGDEIFFGDPNSMEGRIDWSGDRMRLQRNNEHYISVDGQGEFRAWANGETYAWFSPIHEDGYTHATMRLGRGILKGLGSGDGLQSRNNNDSGYAPMTASRFNVPFNGDVNFYNGRRIYPSGMIFISKITK